MNPFYPSLRRHRHAFPLTGLAMSEFEILIPLAFLTFVFIIVSKLIKNRHERKKWELTRSEEAAGNSLTTTELQFMIEEAVARATADLEERLVQLERPQLEPPSAVKTLGREPAHQ